MMTSLQWETHVPMFKNPYILRGMGLAIGMPFGIVIVTILVASKGDVLNGDAKYALGMVGVLLLLTFLTVMLVYGGNYAPGFIVDDAGITNYTQAAAAKRNRIINTLVTALGLVSGNPTAVGTGMIAQSRQVMRLKWKQVRQVRYDPKHCSIVVRGGYMEKIVVFCTKENYPAVEAMIKEKSR